MHLLLLMMVHGHRHSVLGPGCSGPVLVPGAGAAGSPVEVVEFAFFGSRLVVLLRLGLGLGRRELVAGVRLLVIQPLELGPLVVLLAHAVGLHGPGGAANLRDDLMVVLRAVGLCEVLVRLAVEHEGVHRALDLSRRLALLHLPEALLSRPVDVRPDVRDDDVGVVQGELTQGLLHNVGLLRILARPVLPLARRGFLDATCPSGRWLRGRRHAFLECQSAPGRHAVRPPRGGGR
jgi:hypothetical protein